MTARPQRPPKWYEKYLPFVAKSPEMQIEWLVTTFRRGMLTSAEITPYIRLLLLPEGEEATERLRELFRELDDKTVLQMLEAADIDDVPRMFDLLARPTLAHALAALKKCPPPYEKSPEAALHKVFHAVHRRSQQFLSQAAELLQQQGQASAQFEKAYERFQEILMDEKILSSLYPKARL